MNGGATRLNSAGEEHGERRGGGGEPGQGADRQHRQEAGTQPHYDDGTYGREWFISGIILFQTQYL